MTTLHLPQSARKELEDIVYAGYPLETCGLLVGQQLNDHVEVSRVVQAQNLNKERAHDRYELAPQDFIAADTEAQKAGLEIVGVWHSHPDHPARPSETDRESAWEGWSYLILAVKHDGVHDLRSWRLASAQFVEESIEPCPR
jgi:proteasome lid subunit RPN8/RPN11